MASMAPMKIALATLAAFFWANEKVFAQNCTSNVTFDGAFFGTGCENPDCHPQVGIDGDEAVVALSLDGITCIHFFSYTNGKFEPSGTFELPVYGISDSVSVAISGNSSVVGNLYTDPDWNGTAHVYEKNASGMWDNVLDIAPTDLGIHAHFGDYVDIDKDVIVIGAPDDDRGDQVGSAYVYRRNSVTWTLEEKLTPVDPKLEAFGYTVAVKGSLIAVGDKNYDSWKGALFLYEFDPSLSTWVPLDNAVPNDHCGLNFGGSPSFTDDGAILVGCNGDWNLYGYVQYFVPSDAGSYTFQQQLAASDGSVQDYFGGSLAVYGNKMIVGSNGASLTSKVYIFTLENGFWTEDTKIEPPEGSLQFGISVGLSGNKTLISSTDNVYYHNIDRSITISTTTPPTSTTSSTTAAHCTSHVTLDGAFFGAGCEHQDCHPQVGIDGDEAVVALSLDGVTCIHFFSFINDNFEPSGTFELPAYALSDAVSVAISGNASVVGSLFTDPDWNGTAHVYEKNDSGMWDNALDIAPTDLGIHAHFGDYVDIDKDVIVIGAPNDDRGDQVGSAYIYRRNSETWMLEEKITPVDPKLEAFGYTVAVKGNLLAVADKNYDSWKGAVFLYEFNPLLTSWTPLDNAVSNNHCGLNFGVSLGFTEDNAILVGCYGSWSMYGFVHYFAPSNAGSSYTFLQEIAASDGISHDYFGANLEAYGNQMVVGSNIASSTSKVYIFTLENGFWTEDTKIEPPEGSVQFGISVGLSGNKTLVSSTDNVYYRNLDSSITLTTSSTTSAPTTTIGGASTTTTSTSISITASSTTTSSPATASTATMSSTASATSLTTVVASTTTTEAATSPTTNSGTMKWYVDHEKEICVKDCSLNDYDPTCGGLASSSLQLFDDVQSCCQFKLSYIGTDKCVAASNYDFSANVNLWYADLATLTCFRNCEGSAPCGGVLEGTSVSFYNGVEECCQRELPFIDQELCLSMADPTSTGTGKYYVDAANSLCLEDCEGSFPCSRAEATAILFSTISECCRTALPWVKSEFCFSRSNGDVSNLWYYAGGDKCEKDCDGSAPCGGTVEDPSKDLFESALQCCTMKVTWTNANLCERISMNEHTEKYYVDYANSKCNQDCPLEQGGACGGYPPDSALTLFNDATTCCQQGLSWVKLSTCTAETGGNIPVGSNKWYVDYVSYTCKRDCIGAEGCGGLTQKLELFETASQCCALKLWWLDYDDCIS